MYKCIFDRSSNWCCQLLLICVPVVPKVVSTVFAEYIFEFLIMTDQRRDNPAFLHKFCFLLSFHSLCLSYMQEFRHLSPAAVGHKWIVMQVYFLFVFFVTRFCKCCDQSSIFNFFVLFKCLLSSYSRSLRFDPKSTQIWQFNTINVGPHSL